MYSPTSDVYTDCELTNARESEGNREILAEGRII